MSVTAATLWLGCALGACGGNAYDAVGAAPKAVEEPTTPPATEPATTAPVADPAPEEPWLDSAVSARLAAAQDDNTTTSITPMGVKFAAAAAVATTDAQKARLSSGTLLPTIPASQTNMQWKPFAVVLYTNAGPSPADIHQHGLGTCGGVAAMGGIAFQNPNFVMQAIEQSSPQRFVVHMYDPQGLPIDVVVDNQFVAANDGSMLQASGENGQANWVTVIEKATMVYNSIFNIFTDTTSPGGTGGIGAEFQVPLLTGNGSSFAYAPNKLQPSDLRIAIAKAMRMGCIVTGGFAQPTVVEHFQVYSYHAYSVFGVGTAPLAMIQMRNPWGCAPSEFTNNCESELDGVVTVALADPAVPSIDVRIINAGAAQAGGRTAAYLPIP